MLQSRGKPRQSAAALSGAGATLRARMIGLGLRGEVVPNGTANCANPPEAHLHGPDTEQVWPRLDLPGSQPVRLRIFGLKPNSTWLKPATRGRQ
jgi:hypothetical protein